MTKEGRARTCARRAERNVVQVAAELALVQRGPVLVGKKFDAKK